MAVLCGVFRWRYYLAFLCGVLHGVIIWLVVLAFNWRLFGVYLALYSVIAWQCVYGIESKNSNTHRKKADNRTYNNVQSIDI